MRQTELQHKLLTRELILRRPATYGYENFTWKPSKLYSKIKNVIIASQIHPAHLLRRNQFTVTSYISGNPTYVRESGY